MKQRWQPNRREFLACGAASFVLFPADAISGPQPGVAVIDPDAVAAQCFLQALDSCRLSPSVIVYDPCACRPPTVGVPIGVTRLMVFLAAAHAYVVEQDALAHGYKLRLVARPLGVESDATIDYASADESLISRHAMHADWSQYCARLCSALQGRVASYSERCQQRVHAVANDAATLLLLERA